MNDRNVLAIRLSDRGMRILRFPLTRLVLALVFLIAFTGLALGLSSLIGSRLSKPEQVLTASVIEMFLVCLFAWRGYWLYCMTIEGRKVTELDPAKGVRQSVYGLLLGFGLISLVMLIMWLAGGYRITGIQSASLLLPALIMAVKAGIVEEILSRGIIFRITEEGLGTTWAVILSALIFGFMHSWNPNATVLSSISIALTAGVVLALIYVITRQLWIPIGLHIGWNFTLGGIYGAPVSGGEPAGLLAAEFPGPDWLTGGAFGPEASVIMPVIFTIFGIYLIRRCLRENCWISPLWRKKHDYTQEGQ